MEYTYFYSIIKLHESEQNDLSSCRNVNMQVSYYLKRFRSGRWNSILSILFFFFLTTISLQAQPPSGGAGTVGSPYIIATLNDLNWIATQVNAVTDYSYVFSGTYFIQTADIDASSTSTWFSNGSGGYYGWKPIGFYDMVNSQGSSFSGIYDGQGHTISGLYINRLELGCVGVFGQVSAGTIKNLGITGASITGGGTSNGAYVGALAGYLYEGVIMDNCYSTGSVSGYDVVGGLIGQDDGSGGANTITNCYSTCTVTVANADAGGLVGYSTSSNISNCYASGSVSGGNTGDRIAGLIGQNWSTVQKSYSTGPTTGEFNVAGFIGLNNGPVSNCYCSGTATSNRAGFGDYCGGFIGFNGSDAASQVNYCYTKSQVISTNTHKGGFVGCNGANGVINNNCFWDTDIFSTGCGQIIGTFSAIGKTTGQMKTASTFTGASWSSTVWSMMDGYYPKLIWQVPTIQASSISFSSITNTTMTVSWTVGDGDQRAVFVKEGTGAITNPTDGTTYTASSNWSSKGTQLGSSGYYCVYNGTGSSESLSNLSGGTQYTVQIFEYDGTGTTAKYLTATATNNPNNQTTVPNRPTVTGISPTSGPTSGSTTVTITGTNLTGASSVLFGSNAATGVTVNSATQITATSPAGSAGTIHITVTTPGGTSATSSSDQFTYGVAPTVTTQTVTRIGSTNAIGNGNITDLGYPNPTAYGICWGVSANPTTSNSKVDKGAASVPGAFTAQLTGLTPGATYHARAFVTNNVETAYGDDVTFTTTSAMTEPGNALNFDGVNDYVVATDNDNSLTAFTIEAWVKWTPSAATDIQFICGKGGEQMELHTGGDAGANGIRFIPTTGVYLDAANILPTGVWTHVAVVYNPSSSLAKMYINGVEVTLSDNGSNPLNTAIANTVTPFYLGSRCDASYRFKGSMDEVRVWNLVRSQSEIQADMDNAISPSSSGLINYYNFNEGTAGGANTAGSIILPDLTSNGNNGTLTNFALTGTTSNWVESYAMVVPIATSATSITVSGFTANWTAPATGSVNNYKLYVATDAAFSSLVAGYNPLTVASTTTAVTGLAANTAYYYRVCADKTTVTGEGARSNTITATTAHIAPVATTVAASSITTTGGTLNGTINANNKSTTVTFQYGLTISYGTTVTATQSPVTGISDTPVSYALSGLVPNTTYHYRVVGVNTAGTTNGGDLTFSTLEPGVPVDLTVSGSTIATGDTCFNATNEITVSTVTVEASAYANFIAGTSVTFLPGFHAISGSYVHAWITEDGSFCVVAGGSPIAEKSALKSAENKAVPENQTIISGEKSIKIYPNPNNGQFSLELSNIESGATVSIYNMLGERVYRSTATNNISHKINLPEIKKGIYFVKVVDGKVQFTRKMIVN
jgi:hypothetical protein